jgi:hypothetical protein
MRRRLRAAVLLFAMLVASLAPTASVSVHAGEAGMECCASEAHCDGPALKRACCPCAPATPADPPAAAPAVHACPQASLPASWASHTPDHTGPVDPGASRAFASLVAQVAPSPPWLLHGAFLI